MQTWWAASAHFIPMTAAHIRERLLSLMMRATRFTYNFEKPAFPVKNYVATLRLYPVTHTDQTFAEWDATFDEAPEDEGKYERHISNDVFAANFRSLAKILRDRKPARSPRVRCAGRATSQTRSGRPA